MGRIKGNRPLNDVVAKGRAISKTLALLGQLSGTLDMERGGPVAQNLRALYEYMMNRLALANGTNDVTIVAEVSALVEEIKSGWDQIVSDER
jgi:flagellar protein FliS